jgi:hypothetical protein
MTTPAPPDSALEELFADARRDVGGDAEMARVRARLLPPTGGGGGGPSARPRRWSPAIAGAGLAAAIAATLFVRSADRSEPARPAAAAAAVSRAAPLPASSAPNGPFVALPSSEAEPAPPQPTPRRARAERRAAPASPLPAEPELTEEPSELPATGEVQPPPPPPLEPSELALIRDARAALATSPAEALALTEQAARAYPTGHLVPEREVIAIDALSRLGRSDEVHRRASTFRARHPGSALLERLDLIESR